MATITQIVCDSCGSSTDVRAIDWEIDRDADRTDLCAGCLATVMAIMMPRTTTVATAPTEQPPAKVPNVKVTTKPVKDSTSAAGTQTVIRAWAKKRGLQVPDKGRVPTEVIQAYQAEVNTAPSLDSLV